MSDQVGGYFKIVPRLSMCSITFVAEKRPCSQNDWSLILSVAVKLQDESRTGLLLAGVTGICVFVSWIRTHKSRCFFALLAIVTTRASSAFSSYSRFRFSLIDAQRAPYLARITSWILCGHLPPSQTLHMRLTPQISDEELAPGEISRLLRVHTCNMFTKARKTLLQTAL
jgi:hypothetical protein